MLFCTFKRVATAALNMWLTKNRKPNQIRDFILFFNECVLFFFSAEMLNV